MTPTETTIVKRVLAGIGVAIGVYGVLAAAGVVSVTLPSATVAGVLGVAIPVVHAAVTRLGVSPAVSTLVAGILVGANAVLAVAVGAHGGTITLDSVLNALWPSVAAAGGSLAALAQGPVLEVVHGVTDKLRYPQFGGHPGHVGAADAA